MPEPDDDRFLSRREVEERLAAHEREHEQQADAIVKALGSDKAQAAQHNIAHDKAHDAHEEKHKAEGEAVKTALVAVGHERNIHADAHEREHVGHQREHGLANLAIDKAEGATDKRFASTNAYREQINEMIRNLAPKETLDVLIKEVDRRFEEQRKDIERRHEELRRAIATLERTDVKAEGRGLGQGAVIAWIVTAITVVSTVLGVIIVISRVP